MTASSRVLVGVVGCVIVFMMAVQLGSAQPKDQGIPKWEYNVVVLHAAGLDSGEKDWADQLNHLGDNSWEVVLAVPPANGRPMRVILKRPKQ